MKNSTFGTHRFIISLLLLLLMMTSCATIQQTDSLSAESHPAKTPLAAEEAEASDSSAAETQPAETQPTELPAADADNDSAENAQATDKEPLSFELTTEGTEARFIVDEVLMGNDKTVVGATAQVTGEITVVPSNPSASQIGTVTINARDFKTDSSRRNRAIQRQVLLTAREEYQFITFTPTALDGMPERIQVGDTVSFTVIGDLTVLDTTRAETFAMSVTVVSEQELTGLASATVLYEDFGISIPRVPIVASVEDEVRLELEFTAKAK